MRHFRIWLEEDMQRQQQQQIQKLYDLTVQQLLGSARDQTHLNLSDIRDDDNSDGPPTNKGAMVAFKKLQKAHVFDRLKNLGNPKLAARAAETENYLQKVSNDQVVGPKDTVGQLLNRLFGDDAVDNYGKRDWKTSPNFSQSKPKEDLSPQQATPNMPQQTPMPMQPPASAPGVMPTQTPPPMGLPPEMPQQPPMPTTPDQQPPLDTNQLPLQSPGGPMPPKPPGGLAMA